MWASIKFQEWWSCTLLCIIWAWVSKYDYTDVTQSPLGDTACYFILQDQLPSSEVSDLPPRTQEKDVIQKWAHYQKVNRGVPATIHIPSTPLKMAKTLGIIYEQVKIAACPLKGCLSYLLINLSISVGKLTIWMLSTF